MAAPLRPPILSYEDLRRRAGDFLRTHNATATIPVPIEEIVEFNYRMDIVPVPGLQDAFEVDGFIASDLKSITVDAFIQERRPARYRFTLAHELGHAVLHRRIFLANRFRRVEDWKRFQRDMDEVDRGWIEWQAYAFAGLILVPAEALVAEYQKAAERVVRRGHSLKDMPDTAQFIIAEWLAKRFEVSAQVIERRLIKDHLWPEEQSPSRT